MEGRSTCFLCKSPDVFIVNHAPPFIVKHAAASLMTSKTVYTVECPTCRRYTYHRCFDYDIVDEYERVSRNERQRDMELDIDNLKSW